MTKAEWKSLSRPLLTRICTLELQAENNGLTDTEREELARLTAEWQDKYIKILIDEVDINS